MAMLQLGGTLSNATVRITPRLSLWATAQHFFNVSSVAPHPDTVDNAVKEESINKGPSKSNYKNTKLGSNETLVTAAFQHLAGLNDEDKPIDQDKPVYKKQYTEQGSLNSKIHSASTVDRLLDTVNNPAFKKHNASAVVHVLCDWVTTGKVTMNEIQDDPRYQKVCQILGIDRQSSIMIDAKSLLDSANIKSPSYQMLQTESVNRQIENLNNSEMISVFVALANRKKRATPILKLLVNKLSGSDEHFNIKKLSDILYSMAALTFYDKALIEKTCNNLLKVIPKNESSAVIGSILTSLGMLRYRDEAVLDLLSTWIVENQDTVRPNEICGLLMTLASLGYTPHNFDEFLESIVSPLKESDMCSSSEWLDIVWALTLLNKATPQNYESVLNDGFLNRIFDTTDTIIARVIKILNINAVARFIPDYKGPFIPDSSSLLDTTVITRPKEKAELSNSVVSALKILLPSDSKYLNTNMSTDMGFTIDAEFCVDNNCTPHPLDSKSEQDKQIFRIAVLTCGYQDYCQNKKEIIGPVKFYKKLAELNGYKALLIPYTDVKTTDKLVLRVKYIKDNVTKLLQNVPTQ